MQATGIAWVFQLLGSVALFLYGMKVMSEGIQKMAGQRLRKNFGDFTDTPGKGIFAGTLVTALLQSSSATTVLIVGLAHAGVIALSQAIWLMMGANIGTTITAWLVTLLGLSTLKLTAFALPALAVAIPMLLTRRRNIRGLGESIAGLALLFLGLHFIRLNVPDFQSHPDWLLFLSNYSLTGGLADLYFKSFLFFLVGMVLTFVVQSSSVAMTLTLIMTAEGWIPLPLAMAIVLGENVGTTLTANIAALVGNIHAKRAARSHSLFNVLGSAWSLLLFPVWIAVVNSATHFLTDTSPMENYLAIPLALSLFHTSFNVINTLLLYPFTAKMEQFVTWMVPSRNQVDQEFRLEFIGAGILETPELSLLEARKEMTLFARNVRKAFGMLPKLLNESDEAELVKHVENIRFIEEYTDRLQIELANYLTAISQGDISPETSATVRNMINAGNQLERATDLILKTALNLEKRRQEKAYFTPLHRKSALEVLDLIQRAMTTLVANAEAGEGHFTLDEATHFEDQINSRIENLQKTNLGWIESEQVMLTSGLYFSDLMNELERIADLIYKAQKAMTGMAGH
jgi:phosphate:Na+ symporter